MPLSLIKFCQHLSLFEGLILTHFFVIYHLFYIIHSVSQLSRNGESPTLKRTHIKAKDWKVELQMSTRHIPQKRILMSKLTETLSTQFEKNLTLTSQSPVPGCKIVVGILREIFGEKARFLIHSANLLRIAEVGHRHPNYLLPGPTLEWYSNLLFWIR